MKVRVVGAALFSASDDDEKFSAVRVPLPNSVCRR